MRAVEDEESTRSHRTCSGQDSGLHISKTSRASDSDERNREDVLSKDTCKVN